MTLPVLRIAVVGHTNTGKTSLLRTLLRDVEFGEVSDAPGTTRSVRSGVVYAGGKAVLELADTPGLEDSIGLLQEIDRLSDLRSDPASPRLDGPARLDQFLTSPAAGSRFAQEAMALRQVLASDAALYVIDSRDPVLAKHRDELTILGYCARPVVPVLNFVAAGTTREDEWRTQLARVNMHAVATFDTVVLEVDGERRLFEKMRTLLDSFSPTLTALIEARDLERTELMHTSSRLLADLLIDVAAHAVEVNRADVDLPAGRLAVESLRNAVRAREQRCVDELLRVHRFRPEDCSPDQLPLESGRWGADLFSPEQLQQYGIRSGGGAAAGALTGLSLDVMLGGMSLGAATALGAAIGAALGAGSTSGRQILQRMQGRTELRCDQDTLRLLAARQLELTLALFRRGHASQQPLRLDQTAPARSRFDTHWPQVNKLLRKAMGRRSWSRLVKAADGFSILTERRRNELLDELTKRLTELLRDVHHGVN